MVVRPEHMEAGRAARRLTSAPPPPALSVPRSNLKHDGEDLRLLAQIRNGSEAAYEALIQRYLGLVRMKANLYFLQGGDSEDLIQEGLIGLHRAIRDYRSDRAASFYTFATLCITRQIISAIKAAARYKHRPLNDYVSFSQSPTDQDDPDLSIGDILPGSRLWDPSTVVVSREGLEILLSCVTQELSQYESDTLRLFLGGLSYEQIVGAIGRDSKAVDNALQRVKRKVTRAQARYEGVKSRRPRERRTGMKTITTGIFQPDHLLRQLREPFCLADQAGSPLAVFLPLPIYHSLTGKVTPDWQPRSCTEERLRGGIREQLALLQGGSVPELLIMVDQVRSAVMLPYSTKLEASLAGLGEASPAPTSPVLPSPPPAPPPARGPADLIITWREPEGVREGKEIALKSETFQGFSDRYLGLIARKGPVIIFQTAERTQVAVLLSLPLFERRFSLDPPERQVESEEFVSRLEELVDQVASGRLRELVVLDQGDPIAVLISIQRYRRASPRPTPVTEDEDEETGAGTEDRGTAPPKDPTQENQMPDDSTLPRAYREVVQLLRRHGGVMRDPGGKLKEKVAEELGIKPGAAGQRLLGMRQAGLVEIEAKPKVGTYGLRLRASISPPIPTSPEPAPAEAPASDRWQQAESRLMEEFQARKVHDGLGAALSWLAEASAQLLDEHEARVRALGERLDSQREFVAVKQQVAAEAQRLLEGAEADQAQIEAEMAELEGGAQVIKLQDHLSA